jgi:hypothetical protein
VKTADYFRFALAFALAALTTVMVLNAGPFAVSACYLLGSVLSTGLILLFGGRHRLPLMAVATIPAYLLITLYSVRRFYTDPDTSDPFGQIVRYVPSFALDLGMTVVIPLLLAYAVHRLRYKTRNA